jgi:long-chain acyl-CoA synthetase
MARANILGFLPRCAARGDEMALAHWRGLRVARWTYARLAAVSYQTARELEARGIGRGDRVLVWAENSPEWVAAFFGCAMRGAIVVPLDAASAHEFVARVQSQVGAKLLFYGDVEAEKLSPALPYVRLSQLRETVARHPANSYDAISVGEDDIVEIIYTSGTTAEPKGVVLTHGNLLANLAPLEREIKKYLKWERFVHPLRFLNLVPLSHVFGQFMGIFVPQLVGGEVFFQNSLKPAEIIETTKRERVSVVVAVPRLLDTLREKFERDQEARGRLSEFRRAINEAKSWGTPRRWWTFRRVHNRLGWKFWAFVVGGATLEEETETFWRRLGYGVVQGYGMTETASLVSVNHPFKSARGSIGRALPGQEIRVGEGGEIEVRGANVSPGYWDGGAIRKSDDAGGWLRTGDVAEVDAGGDLYFKGRKKDVIVTAAGLNIYPEDIEAELNRQAGVRASAVVGVAGARGEEAVAVLVLRDERANVEEIVRRANERLARHQQIRRWLIWHEPDLPRTATQKIIRRKVANVAAARLAGVASASGRDAPSATDALAEIITRVGGQVAATQLSPSSNLTTDLKLDSLGRVELLGALEDRYQIEIDEAAFTAATTLDDVRRLINQGARESTQRDRVASVDGEAVTTRGALASDKDALASDKVRPYPYPRWARRFPATWIRIVLLHLVVRPLVRLMCPLRVEGRERLTRLGDSPALFVANHVTRADQALVMAALPATRAWRLAVAMEGELLRDWRHAPTGTSLLMRLRWLGQYALVVTFFNVFPLPKKSGFRRSFAYAGESVDQGFNLLIFPEGVRAKEGHMNSFMAGTGLLVKELDVPVVPVRVDGLYQLKREGRRHALPGEVSVTFGEPLRFTDEEPNEIAKELERRVASL